MIYHVSKNGNDKNAGTEVSPFLTISHAAAIAEEGDTVIVHAGIYRECVDPANGARSSVTRITYTAAEGERVVIKGSEEVSDWEQTGGGVWKAAVSNKIFGSYNPYREVIDGDWLMKPLAPLLHTGQVYLNGKALSEAPDIGSVAEREMTWYAEVTDWETVLYANFGEDDPNGQLTEINVRRSCFYPEKTGIDHITVRGFEFAQSASPWAPPTADQPAMVGTHWSKGWIIEDNILHDARCSAISVGKEISTGHNLYNRYHRKPGYQHQLEAVFAAKKIGWSKENIGSHIIRNNTIYDCGQNGIVGHLGGAFSEIYGNHIYNIGNNHEFFGYEIAGIKLHAAIDTQIHHNHIHDCLLGMWFDWQAQGMRISSNLYYNNETDMWIEVTHGPHLVDNNIFGSERNLKNAAQGGAYVHNIFCGASNRYDVRDRSTPYHLAHSTDIMGTAVVYGGDDRFYNNIFSSVPETDSKWICGTEMYNGSPSSMEEYISCVLKNGKGDIETYINVRQPAYINNNYYIDGAKAFENEKHSCTSAIPSNIRVIPENDGVYLEMTLDKNITETSAEMITTKTLGLPRISEAPYENPDETPICIDKDILGNLRKKNPTCGPVEDLKPGTQRILILKRDAEKKRIDEKK